MITWARVETGAGPMEPSEEAAYLPIIEDSRRLASELAPAMSDTATACSEFGALLQATQMAIRWSERGESAERIWEVMATIAIR
tara:strand:- start:550 stop:801 length:252 start_codon:yes stop_codon:yes gene_type:complete